MIAPYPAASYAYPFRGRKGQTTVKRLALPEWAALAEITGTVAIVASLLFVAYEINRNTLVVQGTGENEIYDAYQPILLMVIQNAEVSRIVKIGEEDPTELNEIELYRYDRYLEINLDLWERAFARFNEDLISDSAWAGWDGYFVYWASRNLTDRAWAKLRVGYDDDFISHVELRLSDE